ncbi:MAG TPA: IscS subfamily cysteine desulfurase [Chitinophagaceae bacterium]|nr:IscS subfamily cysteine desulfurase [Chitinophagaceae bacterium]
MLQFPVYLDYNATTPCDPRVVEAMLPYFGRYFGNPASHNHSFGWEAEEAVEQAREQVAKLIGADPKEIIFTSGATEADNLAIKGVFETYAVKGNHIITCSTEHKAVLDTCKHLEKNGAEVTYLEVDSNGSIDIGMLEAAIKPSTILIAIMYANNETGTIMPVKEIGAIAKRRGVIFFSDATQAVGKIPVNVISDGIDLLSLSGHKIYGPKGVGALYIRRKGPRVKLTAQLDGGGHERGIRSGTLNVPGIVGLGKACEISHTEMENELNKIKKLRDRLETDLLQIEGSSLNGDKNKRLPNVTNIAFKYAEGDSLIMAINKNIAVSSGAACSSATPEPSHVLKAMGLDDESANSSIRFSLGRFTTGEEIDYVVEEVTAKSRELKKTRTLIQETNL